MIQDTDDLIQFSSPKPNLLTTTSAGVKKNLKTPISLLDSSFDNENTPTNAYANANTNASKYNTINTDLSSHQFMSDENDQTTLNNQDNLDIVDFSEVANELINIDNQDIWLCEPKTKQETNTTNNTNNILQLKPKKDIIINFNDQINNLENENEKENINVNNLTILNQTNQLNSNSTIDNESNSSLLLNQTNIQLSNSSKKQLNTKNPYKWIMDEFDQDKNLDKVKRTLLVTLDDISKGFNRRSRSVSTSRSAYHSQYLAQQQHQAPTQAPPPTPIANSNHHHHHNHHHHNHHNHHHLHHNTKLNDTNHYHESTSTNLTHLQSKSIESILNESTAENNSDKDLNRTYSKEEPDLMLQRPSVIEIFNHQNNNNDVIDSNYHQSNGMMKPTINGYSTATIVKSKKLSQNVINKEINLIDIYDDGLNNMNHQQAQDEQHESLNRTYSNSDIMSSDQSNQHYNDIIDVQVIAKIQEENLRQSVLNINKLAQNETHNKQQQQHSYSSATITKRINNPRPSFPMQNLQNNNEYENAMRRDSASSSEHSSISSTASNYESPYTSHLNMNGIKLKSPKKPINNYSTITKSSTITHGISTSTNLGKNHATSSTTSTSSRSSTPSKVNSSILKHESRLPTPRSSRSSISSTQSNNLNITQKSAQSKSPSNFISRNLQLAKPPIAPTNNFQTPSSNLSTTRSGRALMSYGQHRSATTSIVPNQKSAMSNNNNNNNNKQLPTNNNNNNNKPVKANLNPNANNNKSIPSSPSSTSSISTSSSIQQIAPLNASSPRSRNQSPSSKIVMSPSGLFTDGPLSRRPIGSPLRDTNREKSNSPLRSNIIGNQLNMGSNSNLHTIQESKIPSHLNSPMTNRKLQIQQKQIRKSFLPQPVQYPNGQTNRQSSISPIRTRNLSPNWKEGCY